MEPRSYVPEKGIMPGKNSTGSDIAKFVFVDIDPAGTDDVTEVELPQAAGGTVYGVVVSSKVREGVSPDVGIPNGEVGDIQIRGICPVLVGAGGVTKGAALQVTTAGAVITAASSDIVVGRALTTAGAGEYAEVELAGPALSRIVP